MTTSAEQYTAWTLHWGLPWTIYACMYSSGLVSNISTMFIPIIQWALTNKQLHGPKQWSRWRNISSLQQGAYQYVSRNVQVGSTLGWIWVDWGCCGEPFISYFYGCCSLYHLQYYFTAVYKPLPHTDIHELLTLGLLHQLIKGAFKVHIITWIVTYIDAKHMKRWANQILNDIDHWWVIQFQFFFYLHNADR